MGSCKKDVYLIVLSVCYSVGYFDAYKMDDWIGLQNGINFLFIIFVAV